MNKSQFRLLIRRATDAIGQSEVYVIGSQAIHAVLPDDEPPAIISMSREADMFPPRDDASGLVASLLEALTGVGSELDIEEGIYVDTVDPTTATLPSGWQSRVLRVAAGGQPPAWGLCPEPNDLCVSKLARAEEKDLEFVDTVVGLGLADVRTIRSRLEETDLPEIKRTRVDSYMDWLAKKRPLDQ